MPKAAKPLSELLDGRKVFGRLTVIEEVETPRAGRFAKCRCECGIERTINVQALKSGVTKSCGCLTRDHAAVLAENTCLTHGDARAGRQAPEYRIYRAMLNRCFNPKVDRYPEYGGRGITVADEWCGKGGYERFLANVGRRPDANHSLDRKDPDGDYRPGNVRWAVKEVQANNKRTSVRVLVGDRDMTVKEMSEASGVGVATLRYRLKLGMTPEAAMSEPIKTGPNAKAR